MNDLEQKINEALEDRQKRYKENTLQLNDQGLLSEDHNMASVFNGTVENLRGISSELKATITQTTPVNNVEMYFIRVYQGNNPESICTLLIGKDEQRSYGKDYLLGVLALSLLNSRKKM